MSQPAPLLADDPSQIERLSRTPRRYADSHELDGWTIIADGDNYRSVKTITIEWLAAHGLEPEEAEDLDLRLDFLAGRDDSPTIRTRLRSDLLERRCAATS